MYLDVVGSDIFDRCFWHIAGRLKAENGQWQSLGEFLEHLNVTLDRVNEEEMLVLILVDFVVQENQ